MAQLLVRDLGKNTVERLKRRRAKRHHRSLQGEVKMILDEAARMSMDDARALAEKIRASLAGRAFSDSAELIRQDRER